MGTRAELAAVLRLVEHAGLHPVIDRVLPLAEAAEGLRLLADGEAFGKIVLDLLGRTSAVIGPSAARPRAEADRGRNEPAVSPRVVQPGQPGGQLLDRALELRDGGRRRLGAARRATPG